LLESAQGDQIIVGGEDHKSGQADDAVVRFDRLEAWARRHFPGLGDVRQRWSGQVMEPVDGLAFLGRNPLDASNVYVATGDSGMGITHGAIAGMLIADLIEGRPNPWETVFAPNRVTSATIGTYIDENLNAVAQLRDYVRPGAVADADHLALGAGGLLRRGARMIAAYRDHAGQLHEHSAICPHIGCIVHWNSLEGCWDCPCHGSQFSGEGKVLNGPARADLASLSRER
jgi:nitrite reductase/ring-hydroxylating ferredoxin subunit